MTDLDLAHTLGGLGTLGAVVAALLLILYRIFARIIERTIAALDRVAQKVDTLDEREAARHAAVREDLARLDTKVSEWRRSDRFERQEREETPTGIRREHTDPGRRG